MSGLWAVVPVKELARAKARLAGSLDAALRRDLMRAMFEDVLDALVRTPALAGIVVATVDDEAAAIARRCGAVVSREDAGSGHSEAVAACARRLGRDGAAMLTLAADIPLLLPADVAAIIAARDARFVIVPSRDLGSNAVLCAPADAVPLRFGGPSFPPHVAAARARGLAPVTLNLPRVALDIDGPRDLAALLAADEPCRARALLADWGIEAIVETTP
jgi:2-phospho-L-lactate/phosphoenolpyruvate guanylyltransferase